MVNRSGLILFSAFQYPRSDRAGCNDCCPPHPPQGWRFSVSSVGSSGMQLAADHRTLRGFRAFSILGRIERDATTAGPGKTQPGGRLSVSSVGSSGMQLRDLLSTQRRRKPFQYPRSDRAGCNLADVPAVLRDVLDFQYPRSDRAGCNIAGGALLAVVGVLSVSSVGSSGMQRRRVALWPHAQYAFSILGRIERDATRQ